MMVDANTCQAMFKAKTPCVAEYCDEACKANFGPNALGQCSQSLLYCLCRYPC